MTYRDVNSNPPLPRSPAGAAVGTVAVALAVYVLFGANTVRDWFVQDVLGFTGSWGIRFTWHSMLFLPSLFLLVRSVTPIRDYVQKRENRLGLARQLAGDAAIAFCLTLTTGATLFYIYSRTFVGLKTMERPPSIEQLKTAIGDFGIGINTCLFPLLVSTVWCLATLCLLRCATCSSHRSHDATSRRD